MTVEVFKTDVQTIEETLQIAQVLNRLHPEYRITFDLDDCDRILRIQADYKIEPLLVISLLQKLGYAAEILPDVVPSDDDDLLTRMMKRAESV